MAVLATTQCEFRHRKKPHWGNALPAPKRRRMVEVKVLARLCTVTTCLELATDSVTGRSRSRDPREIKNYTIKFIITAVRDSLISDFSLDSPSEMTHVPVTVTGYRRGLCYMYRIRRYSCQLAAPAGMVSAWSRLSCGVWTADYDDGIVDCENAGPCRSRSHLYVTQGSSRKASAVKTAARPSVSDLQGRASLGAARHHAAATNTRICAQA